MKKTRALGAGQDGEPKFPNNPPHPARQADIPFHPLANILPMIEGPEFDRLVADIAEHKLHNPITLYQGKILDGRNRQRACALAGVEPRYEEFNGKDPAAFVLSQNLTRRHLGPSERAMVAARMANLKWGQRSDRLEGSIDLSTAAKLVSVSEPSVKRAKVVIERGTPELQQAVEHGRIAVHEAAKAAKESPEAQADFLAAAGAGKNYMVWSTDRRRRDKATTLAQTTRALPVGEMRWSIILVDPPWQYDDVGISTANRRIENHYPTLPLTDILALPVEALATDDAVLFLWTTAPMLMAAGRIIEAWGFSYKTGLVWDKGAIGTGYWVRNQHEHLLIAVRGNPPHPPMAVVPGSVIHSPRREHSRKPDEAYALIERMYPELPKIELFARNRREGWESWGNQAPEHDPLAIPPFLVRGAL
jgi:N6-adenosine-specific RNA methylase IME4